MKKFRKKLKELPKKTMALLMVFSMLLNYVLPITTVFALDSYTITFEKQGTHTMEIDGGHLKIDGQFVELRNSSNESIGTASCNPDYTQCQISGATETGKLNYGGNDFTLYNTTGHTQITFDTEFNSNQVLNVEDYASATPQVTFEDINVNATFNNTSGEITFNNGAGRTDEGTSYNGTLTNAGYTDNSKTNEITITTAFGEPFASKITVNSVDYNTNNTDTNTIEVAGASDYTIVVQGNTSAVTPKTIIWTNPDYVPEDELDAAWTSQFSIGHGYAKVVEVYDENNQLLDPSEYINTNEQPDGTSSDKYGVNNGFGFVSVMPGSRVVFEFVPEYGYQLTSISLNETPMEATGTMNRYEVVIPNANIHFGATFTRTEDVVKANSSKVSSGNINLGNELAGGSAQLTVNDVELSSDKISGFENAAGDYTISNYLDIDLYNVFYKGKNDANDVWSNKISELDEYATITIKLEDGIDANDIVIVHNIHDGDEYEVIEIESYDPETNTITFKTKSFSNYAIATKTSTQTDNNSNSSSSSATTSTTSNPQTGDNITTYFITLLLSIAGLTGASLIVNKRRKFARN